MITARARLSLFVLTVATAATLTGQAPAPPGDWPHRDGDPAATRFSRLTQITPANVARLEKVWSFDAGEGNLQLTPLVVDGVMYVAAGKKVWALEPETAKVLWTFEAPDTVSRRGLAYWPGDGDTGPRLYTGAGENLLAIDVKDGKVAASFGDGGYQNLKRGIVGDTDGRISMVSPPSVFRNVVITGGNNGEQSPALGLYGDIRGWDAKTGRLLWQFHTVPRPGEPGIDTWEGTSWKDRTGTNMWSFFTVDTARGIVYAPLGSPTSDYYGGDRKGKNLYGNSIVALDAVTGQLKWYQQLIHHDLWDFDLPAAPVLIDVRKDGKTIPAVAVLTKVATLFIFNRETGEPVFGMEERPVPPSDTPGEQAWPTQPFPLKPAPLGRIDFDPAKDFYDLTPEHEAFCKALWKEHAMYTKGPFTPPGPNGTMVTFPSTLGGGNWNGLAYDPTRGLVFTNVMNLGQVAQMVEGKDRSGRVGWMRQAPWGGPVGRFWNPENKVPCSKPPFGELVAVNVNTGDIAWKTPIGIYEELKAKGFEDTGAPNIGGPMVTQSGVLFVGATIDKRFRAFDAATGKRLWETTLDASAHSVPMTFMGKDGRQYVVVAAGGGSFLGSPPGRHVVAFALPEEH